MFDNPKLDAPLIDRPAYVFCVLEAMHLALRRRDVYAVGADKWVNPRVRLIEDRLWARERDSVPRALSLDTLQNRYGPGPAVSRADPIPEAVGGHRNLALGQIT